MSDTRVNVAGNPLDEALVNAKTRRIVYVLFGLIGLVLATIGLALAILNEIPRWYLITTVVYNSLQPYFAALATRNVNRITK